MTTELPKSPDDMPNDWHNDENAIRNCLVTLDENRCVDIHWEQDSRATALTGEADGQWTVEVINSVGRYVAKHRDITNALWFATTMADARWFAAHDLREQRRKEALAKLTADERALLGFGEK